MMHEMKSTMAELVAKAAREFQHRRTGHEPQAVTVVLSGETLVITLHGALSPAERALASSPEGAAQVQEFHRRLFEDAADPLRAEIKRITGVAVREARAASSRRPGPWSRSSRPGRWCRCSSWPGRWARALGPGGGPTSRRWF